MDTADREVLTVAECASFLRISRNKAYDLINEGRLPHIRLGRSLRVPRRGLDAWIASESGLPAEDTVGVSLPRRQTH